MPKLGRPAPEPYPEPHGTRTWWWSRMRKEIAGTSPGTVPGTLPATTWKQELTMEQCQKTRETSPEPHGWNSARKWWWNRIPKRRDRTRRNQEMMMGQNAKRIGGTSPGTLPGTRQSWWSTGCFLEEFRTPLSSWAVWGKRTSANGRKEKGRPDRTPDRMVERVPGRTPDKKPEDERWTKSQKIPRMDFPIECQKRCRIRNTR